MAYLGNPPSSLISTSATTETFTGNGGTTFTLDRSIGDSNPSSVEVFVSNVQQQPVVSYSIVSGNVLTFSQAPGVGEPIYIIFRDHPTAPKINIPDLAITSSKLATGAVTETKIATNAVTSTKILDSAVTEAKLQESSVTNAKIAPLNVSENKIASASIVESKIADNAVTGIKIAENAVSGAKIANESISTSKIANSSVTSVKINIDGDVNFNNSNIDRAGLGTENVSSASNVLRLNYANATFFISQFFQNTTLTPNNVPAGGCVMVLRANNAGAYTVSYAGTPRFAGNTAPSLTSAGTDYLFFICESDTNYLVTSQVNAPAFQ